MWSAQLGLAERGIHVIAPQFRGFDDAEADPPASSIDDYAADVIDLLDALHVEDAVICGLSMGGYVAFAMFRHAPRYFRGLVLADTRPQADPPEAAEARKRLAALVREQGAVAAADEMIPKLLGETTRREHPAIADEVRKLVLANSSDAIVAAIGALKDRADSTRVMAEIHCPTLIIVGEEDRLTPPELSEGMHRAIAGSELARIESAGHLPNLERPEAFNTVVARFLETRV